MTLVIGKDHVLGQDTETCMNMLNFHYRKRVPNKTLLCKAGRENLADLVFGLCV